jgi:MFS family permease
MTTPDLAPAADKFAAFRHRPFLFFWVSRFLASFAVQIISVCVAWQVYDLTRDPFDLGLVGILQFAPSLILVLVTGAVSDRYGRRLIMGLCEIVEALCAAALLYFTLSGSTSATPIFVILVIIGTARAFFGPAAASLAANLVPEDVFANAVSWNSSAWQVASIVGPVAGGLLYGVSPIAAYCVASIMLSVSAVAVLAIPKPRQHSTMHGNTLETILGGFHYIFREKIVLGAVSLDLFAVLLGGAVALLPVYARDILVLGPWGLGLLRAAPGVGAVLVRSGLPATRSATVRDGSCSSPWRCSASSPSSSAFRPRHGCRSWRSPFSGPPMAFRSIFAKC